MCKKVVLFVLAGVFLMTVPVMGADIPAKVKDALVKADLRVYPGAVYCTGSLDIGVRLATSDSPEKVRAWYQENYPKWSVQDKYGAWWFYDGPPNLGPGGIMSTRNMTVQTNKQLPGWHSLPADMTTEILMASPEQAE